MQSKITRIFYFGVLSTWGLLLLINHRPSLGIAQVYFYCTLFLGRFIFGGFFRAYFFITINYLKKMPMSKRN